MEKKSLFVIGGVIIGVFIAFIVVIKVLTTLKPTKYDYKTIETKLKQAAIKYYKDKPETLPSSDGTYQLSYSILESNGYLKPLNEITKDNVACTGHVIMIKSGTELTYIPYLNCGEAYSTKELASQILYNNPVVTQEKGLYYTTSGEYFFRGKVDNVYVAFGKYKKGKKELDIIWKIIGINNNQVKLKLVTNLSIKTKWDDRYNEKENKDSGYNDFDTSLLSEKLTELKDKNLILDESEVSKLVSQKLCINSRTIHDNTKNGSTECARLSKDEYYFGTITPYEYMRASLDELCTTLDDRSCSNFNYLSNDNSNEEWTITPYTLDNSTSSAYAFTGNIFEERRTSYSKTLYPTITLSKYSFYESGTGSMDDPYRIK